MIESVREINHFLSELVLVRMFYHIIRMWARTVGKLHPGSQARLVIWFCRIVLAHSHTISVWCVTALGQLGRVEPRSVVAMASVQAAKDGIFSVWHFTARTLAPSLRISFVLFLWDLYSVLSPARENFWGSWKDWLYMSISPNPGSCLDCEGLC